MNLVFTHMALPKGSRLSKVVEEACAKRRDEATLRLARITNGADPKYKNGKRLVSK